MYNNFRFTFNPVTCEYWTVHFYWNKKTDETYLHITKAYKANEKIQKYFAEHGKAYYSETFKGILIDINKETSK